MLARAGHERAFEVLVDRYRRDLLTHARGLLTDVGPAEDAVQQAFLQAWLALERGTEVTDVKSWLHRITHNASLRLIPDPVSEHAELPESLAGAGTPHDHVEQRMAARDALAGVAALPALQREVVVLTALDGRRQDEVAAQLGLTDGAVRGLLYRARVTLRNAAGALIRRLGYRRHRHHPRRRQRHRRGGWHDDCDERATSDHRERGHSGRQRCQQWRRDRRPQRQRHKHQFRSWHQHREQYHHNERDHERQRVRRLSGRPRDNAEAQRVIGAN
ncbi:MAG: RNA polymerase sigma factor [Solirubrobacteraceae bacterium]